MSRKESKDQEKFMSWFFRGKEIFKPLNTGIIDERVKCLREYVANIFFYTKNGKTIMVDAGYNYGRLGEKMKWLDLLPEEIEDILITHLDTDHVGAIEVGGEGLFRHGKIYVGTVENEYLEGQRRRKVFWGLYTLPQVHIEHEKVLIEDGEIFYLGEIKVEAFLVPGHTWGHLVYLIDDEYLFMGDTIWLGVDGGYAFLHVLAEDGKLQTKSLANLEKILRKRNLTLKIITGHTGWCEDLNFTFAHINEVISGLKKPKVHDPSAPYDGYEERDDTEERTRGEGLKKCGP